MYHNFSKMSMNVRQTILLTRLMIGVLMRIVVKSQPPTVSLEIHAVELTNILRSAINAPN